MDEQIKQVDRTPADIIIFESESSTKNSKPYVTVITDWRTGLIISFNVAHSVKPKPDR